MIRLLFFSVADTHGNSFLGALVSFLLFFKYIFYQRFHWLTVTQRMKSRIHIPLYSIVRSFATFLQKVLSDLNRLVFLSFWEKPDFASEISISSEDQAAIYIYIYICTSQWILKIKIEKLLWTLPNSFLLTPTKIFLQFLTRRTLTHPSKPDQDPTLPPLNRERVVSFSVFWQVGRYHRLLYTKLVCLYFSMF